MTPIYFDTRFKLGLPLTELPDSFAIITAHATTGEVWTAEDNNAANEALRAELKKGWATHRNDHRIFSSDSARGAGVCRCV